MAILGLQEWGGETPNQNGAAEQSLGQELSVMRAESWPCDDALDSRMGSDLEIWGWV